MLPNLFCQSCWECKTVIKIILLLDVSDTNLFEELFLSQLLSEISTSPYFFLKCLRTTVDRCKILKKIGCYKNLFDNNHQQVHCLYATDKLEMLASPILPSKNVNMNCHMNISGIPRCFSSLLSFCYRHFSTIFFSHLIWITWDILTSRKAYYGTSADVTLLCKILLGLICETLSRGLLSPTCALFTLNHNFHSEWAAEAWHRKLPGDQWAGVSWGKMRTCMFSFR